MFLQKLLSGYLIPLAVIKKFVGSNVLMDLCFLLSSENQEEVIRPKYFTRYNRPAHDSEMETDFDSENTENYSESSESENDDDDAPRKRHREGSEQTDQKGWFSSCSIL